MDFMKNAFLGYMACCEGDYSLEEQAKEKSSKDLLDEVVQAAIAAPQDEISLEEACLAAGVDFDSLSHAEIQYILKAFASERMKF